MCATMGGGVELGLCISGRASGPKRQKHESAQKVGGFRHFEKECQKVRKTAFFLRTFLGKKYGVANFLFSFRTL